MKAVCWYGKGDVRVETVPEPKLLNPRDAIIKITLSAICGSDVHLYNGYIPAMHEGDILGHECIFFFQAEDGIRDGDGHEAPRLPGKPQDPASEQDRKEHQVIAVRR